LQGTPKKFNPEKVKEALVQLEGVKEIHDLHIWTLDGQMNVATLHVVVDEQILSLSSTESIKKAVRSALVEIEIEHATIEIEDQDSDCGMEACAEVPIKGAAQDDHDHSHEHEHDHDHKH
jgi:cobalt-zinc-cadmium efflux system protein